MKMAWILYEVYNTLHKINGRKTQQTGARIIAPQFVVYYANILLERVIISQSDYTDSVTLLL
jgi:hypothetical protein